jgi:hypothetical protein
MSANSQPKPRHRLSLREKHDLALKKVERFSRVLPGLSPGAEDLRINMLRSAKAELALRKKALAYAAAKAERRAALYTMFGLLPAKGGDTARDR